MIQLIFIGTGAHGAPLLKALAKDPRFNIALVLTAEDKPAGRKMDLHPSPIKQVAQALGLPLYETDSINSEASLAVLKAAQPDMICLISYGHILKTPLLTLAPYGAINVHLSLLPAYRGASCYQQALLNGDTETGITVMKMVEAMDAGPIAHQHRLAIDNEDNAITLHDKLADLSAHNVPNDLVAIAKGTLAFIPQDESKASYCGKIHKSSGQIIWSEPATTLHNQVRAYAGWPGSFAFWNEKRLKVLKTSTREVVDNNPRLLGHVIKQEDSIVVQTGAGLLELLEVQIEGKNPQLIQQFVNGYKDFVGSTLS
ncbi:methionyl-tRNA formyltransferase [Candidatus Peregrinibacteria bacterium]|nr:MAG: methionyl-tRNA formyltransferase [Candidatus Peregrinibacteria bacterium]